MICRITSTAAGGLLYPMHAAFMRPRPCSALTLPRCCSSSNSVCVGSGGMRPGALRECALRVWWLRVTCMPPGSQLGKQALQGAC